MSRAFKHDIQHPVHLTICIKRYRQPVMTWLIGRLFIASRRWNNSIGVSFHSPWSETSYRSVTDCRLASCSKLLGIKSIFHNSGSQFFNSMVGLFTVWPRGLRFNTRLPYENKKSRPLRKHAHAIYNNISQL